MGKIIAFWSPYAGHGKVTASLCAVIGGMVIQYPEIRLAVSHAQNEAMPLIKKMDSDAGLFESTGCFTSFGIDMLKIYAGQNKISPEIIRRCGLPLLGQMVYFYPNNARTGKEEDKAVQILTGALKEEFDIVCLDLGSGNAEEIFPYMKASDFVTVVLPQEPFYVDKFFREKTESLNGIEYGIIIGGCFLKSKYKSVYYKNEYRKRKNNIFMGDILLNCEFFNAMSEGKALDFFLRNSVSAKNEENYEFVIRAKKTAERIRNKVICP